MENAKQHQFELTHALRGIAVFIYVTSHYRVVVWEAHPQAMGYSNAAIALFFLVSGYGIYHSLQRRECKNGLLRSMPRFWWERLLKILPQHVVAVGLIGMFSFTEYSWWQYVGVKSPFWSIGQAIQCYILAPILYKSVRSTVVIVKCAPICIWIAGNVYCLYVCGEVDRSGMLGQFVFRNLYGTHVLLFYLGLLAANTPLKFCRTLALVGGGPLLAVWLGSLFITGANEASPWILAACTCGGVGVSTLFFHAVMALPKPLPAAKVFASIGRASLSVNLFEPMLYFALFSLDLVRPKAYQTLVWYAAFIPVFIFGCMWIQRTQNAFPRAMQRILSRASCCLMQLR